MKKLIFYLTVSYLVSGDGFSQVAYNGSFSKVAETSGNAQFRPVFFNYHKRQLFYDGCTKVNPALFLKMCRCIEDSAVQYQVGRYDGYTHNKYKMGVAAAVAGIAGMVMLNTATMNSTSSSGGSSAMFTYGFIGILTIPVMAIISSVPHQKRKEVLFRDLPMAYNAYVLSLTTKK